MSYVRFYSTASFTLGTDGNTQLWNGASGSKLEYSTDTSTWTTWDASAPISAALDSNTNKYNLYLRGTQLYALVPFNINLFPRYIFTGTQPIDSEGVLGSLFNYTSVDNDTHNFSLQTGACAYMFYNQTLLRTAPDIDFNISANYVFNGMFRGCTGLISAPSFLMSGSSARAYCCNEMFYGCTSLTSAPELSPTILANYCYAYMFYGCTSLTTAPALPATTLANYCYATMFQGCTSLTTAPALPATILANSCYSTMFQNCTSLTTAPQLPATTLASSCYQGMFQGCISLTTAPALPATTLASSCYQRMFQGCTSLAAAPSILPAISLTDRCYQNMFSGCTSLTTSPELPATTLNSACYIDMFLGCTSLTTAPELPATKLTNNCYESMFYDCTSLTIPPKLPATILANRCYYGMFAGCASLESLPELFVTTLTDYCYEYMFSNSGIELSTTQHDDYTVAYRIPSSGTGTLGTDSLSNMFYNSGISTPSINTTYYVNVPVISSKIKYMATKSEITSIATAIREKTGNSISLTYPDDFISEIDGIQPGEITAFYSGSSLPASSLGVNGDLYTYTGS